MENDVIGFQIKNLKKKKNGAEKTKCSLLWRGNSSRDLINRKMVSRSEKQREKNGEKVCKGGEGGD